MATNASPETSLQDTIRLLAEASGTDTVYGDIYVSHARELLARELPRASYQALKGTERDVELATREIRTATVARDWARVDELRRPRGHASPHRPGEGAAGGARRGGVGRAVGADRPVLARARVHPPASAATWPRSAMRSSRRSRRSRRWISRSPPSIRRGARSSPALALASKATDTSRSTDESSARLEQLAMQAAQTGDLAQLQRHARLLAERGRRRRRRRGRRRRPRAPPRCPRRAASQRARWTSARPSPTRRWNAPAP